MENSAVIFQQKINTKGNLEFRSSFGRSKAMVLRRYNGYFYVDLYDNRKGHTEHISLGLDEIDFIVDTRQTLEQLKDYFPVLVSFYYNNVLFIFFSLDFPCIIIIMYTISFFTLIVTVYIFSSRKRL